ncbi:hypothetical protein [Mongoliibacter ruber]|uniref:DUF4352 domain-containing protein n=1 Tax=Mongoliibacter ruber TaxID=1750599 RepID=A0A2T0WKG7_9BACT|nr:hypothetical protein [Mongoliibacter ruber]PRY87201.1 hypothetical protein CLW00_107271 [Mongoliibacter ruber]
MKNLAMKMGRLILVMIMMVVLNAACSGPEEDFEPIQQEPPQEETQTVDEADVEEEEEEEVEIPVRLAIELDGHDFSEESKKGFILENYTKQEGDVIEINLVRIVSGEEEMYKIPGFGYNGESGYGVLFSSPDEENEHYGFEIILRSGKGESYDGVVAIIRNKS